MPCDIVPILSQLRLLSAIVIMDGTPLPELPPRLHNSPSVLGAYPQILNVERNEQAAYSRDPSADRCKRLIYARILGYLILEGPSDQARVAVALEVNACNGEEEKLLAIGQLYFDHYIRACKLQNVCLFFVILKNSSTVRMNKGRTPTPSNHVSRPSFNNCIEMIKAMVVEAPQNHQQAKGNVSAADHVISTQRTIILTPFQGLGSGWISMRYIRPIRYYFCST